MGSWITYGLGSESQSLPAYVVLPDPNGALEAGQPMYANGFLPSVYQPTMIRGGAKPIRNLDLPAGVSLPARRETVNLIRQLNEAVLPPNDDELAARIGSYELAFKMQTEAPEVFSLAGETKETLDLYGIGAGATDDYGRRCLLARRLVEKACASSPASQEAARATCRDAHSDIEEKPPRRPAAPPTGCSVASRSQAAACLETSWFSGAGNSAALPKPRREAATITTSVSACLPAALKGG